jgi:hypothetical protein
MQLDDKPQVGANEPQDDSAEAIWAELEAEEAAAASGQRLLPEEPAAPAPDRAEEPDEWDAAAEPETKPEPVAAQPAPAAEEDPWANAPEPLRESWKKERDRVKELEHRLKSDGGRISALQRKIDELSRAASTAAQPAAPAAGEQKAPNAAQAAAATSDVFGSDQWKQIEEDYPEIAAPLRAAFASLKDEIEPIKQQSRAVEEDRQRAALIAEQDRLTQEIPDWNQTLADNGVVFATWLDVQPRHLREAFERNREAITDAAEAADVVRRFKEHLGTAQPQQPAPAGTSQHTGASNERRTRQLASLQAAPAKPAPRSSRPDMTDVDQIWAQLEREGL